LLGLSQNKSALISCQEFGPTLKRHHLTALPPYLILHIKRFTKNNFVEERNPTVVNFPLRGVELSDCKFPTLFRPHVAHQVDVDPKPSDPIHTVYDLLSSVTLRSTTASTTSSGTGPGVSKKNAGEENQASWKIHVRAGQGGGDEEKWFEMEDLRVEEVRREMVFLGETVIQVWERRDLSTSRS
jgi:U4/U6.U5 tri-snRNP-associated protein 2